MSIYVDGMGGDNAPSEIVKGCVQASKEFNEKITIIGDESAILSELNKYDYSKELIDTILSTEVISNNEEPTLAIRKKKDSSLVIGCKKIKEDPNSILVSAGSTGAILAGGLLIVGRIKGIQRPAITVSLPSTNDFVLLLDSGANADCKPVYMQQFAIMSSIYAQDVLGVNNPRIGLINIGTEENKGNELTKESYELLKNTSGINFTGNLEARNIMNGTVDIVICDGFTGNVVLKTIEGVAEFLMKGLKDAIMSSFTSKVGGMLAMPAIKEFKKKLDYSEVGGAPLLGINGSIIKAHGSSNNKAIVNAIGQGINCRQKDIVNKISNKIVEIKE